MTTLITLMTVALLAALATSMRFDVQGGTLYYIDNDGTRSEDPSPVEALQRQQSASRSEGPSPDEALERQQRASRKEGQSPDEAIERQQRASRSPHRPGRPIRPIRPIRRRSPSPIVRHRLHDPFHHRGRRSEQPNISELETQVTKGEYVCGDRICKMTPEDVPKNCPPGMCQRPMLPPAPRP